MGRRFARELAQNLDIDVNDEKKMLACLTEASSADILKAQESIPDVSLKIQIIFNLKFVIVRVLMHHD